jgi:hypothetical protein
MINDGSELEISNPFTDNKIIDSTTFLNKLD